MRFTPAPRGHGTLPTNLGGLRECGFQRDNGFPRIVPDEHVRQPIAASKPNPFELHASPTFAFIHGSLSPIKWSSRQNRTPTPKMEYKVVPSWSAPMRITTRRPMGTSTPPPFFASSPAVAIPPAERFPNR